MSEIPADLRYTEEHEWTLQSGTTTVRIGITDYAQAQLGDVVFVQLPEIGASITAGESFGEVESTKSVSDLYAPLSGTVTAVNGSLEDGPDLVNTDPYGDGWLIELEVESSETLTSDLEALLTADDYRVRVDG